MGFVLNLPLKRVVLLVGLTLLILVSITGIFLLNKSHNNTNIPKSGLTNNLKGYENFKQKFNDLNLPTDSRYYPRLAAQIDIIENNNSTAKARYDAFVNINQYLGLTYADNRNNNIYTFIQSDLTTFVKNNFSDYYNKNDFGAVCLDPSCSDTKDPQAILDIISEINSLTDIPEYAKNGAIFNLKNNMYYPSDNLRIKVNFYLNTANLIRQSEEFTKAGVNNKIADEIENFIKNTYPKEYEQIKI